MKRSRPVYEDDHARIRGWVDNLPNYKFGLVGRGEASTNRLLKRACTQRGVDTTALFEKSEFQAALERVAADDACLVCLEDFVSTDRITLLLCGHEFHRECVHKWAASQFEGTNEMPRCPVCRGGIKPRV